MSFGAAIRACFRRGLTFSGRAGRPEFWWFFLFVNLGLVAAAEIDTTVFGMSGAAPVSGLFLLAVFLPLLAAAWRRMQDTGRSGLYVLYPLIVFIGVTSYIGMIGGAGLTEASNVQDVIVTLGGLVAVIGMFVFMISPLLVLWWLSRPSQPSANKWGLPP